jgi:hypothetical protein
MQGFYRTAQNEQLPMRASGASEWQEAAHLILADNPGSHSPG